jgi:hypothetical protein
VLLKTNSVRIRIYYNIVKVDSNGDVIGTEEVAKPWEYQWSNNKGTNDKILLGSNCYFQNNLVKIVLDSRLTAFSSWKEGSHGYIDITGSHLKIRIEGSYYYHSLRLGGDARDGYAQFK